MTHPNWPGKWMTSWDGHTHGFHELGELNSTAFCGHIAATSSLKAPADDARGCVACLLVHGQSLTDRTADGGDWRSQ